MGNNFLIMEKGDHVLWSLTSFKGSTLHRAAIAVPWVGGQARMCTYLRNVLKLHEEEEGIEEQT
jgi:hypothetical protein